MLDQLKQLWKRALKRPGIVLAAGIAIYTVVFAAICFRKYALLGYNGIDLAYFNQVFWNSLHGRFFTQSIHPHLSLGDHAELAIIPLLPFYAIHPDPRTLLALQALAMALPAWPIFLLARERLRRSAASAAMKEAGPLLLALAWLLNPIVQNVTVFEFHILPFAIVPLLFALVEYERGRQVPWLLWTLAALIVREDVALAVAALGLLAWIEKKRAFWKIAPLILGAAWFLAALRLIASFSPDGGYKFMIYYSWLGATPAQALLGLFAHPLRTLLHVLTLANLEMVLGFLLTLVFLPLLGPRALILAAGPLLQIVLGAPGGGELILRTHYAVLFLPALFLAAADGLPRVNAVVSRVRRFGIPDARLMTAVIGGIGLVYAMLVLGPLRAAAAGPTDPGLSAERVRIAKIVLQRIPDDASVAAGYALLPMLSSREHLYSLHYQFLGVTQFGLTPYVLPADTRFVALDTSDLIAYRAQFLNTAWAEPHYADGFARLRSAVGMPVFADGQFILYDRSFTPMFQSVELLRRPEDQNFLGGIALAGAAETLVPDDDLGTPALHLVTAWSADRKPSADLVMRLTLKDLTGRIALERTYPFGNGLYPATELTPEALTTDLYAPLAGLAPGRYLPELALEKDDLVMVLDDLGSDLLMPTEKTPYGRAVLPPIAVK